MLDLDAADSTYLEEFLPEGALPTEFVVIVKFLSTDGTESFKAWSPSDSGLDQLLGLLEMAKLRFVATSRSFERWQDEAGS